MTSQRNYQAEIQYIDGYEFKSIEIRCGDKPLIENKDYHFEDNILKI